MIELIGALIVICLAVILFCGIIIPILIGVSVLLIPFLIYVSISNRISDIKMKFRRRKKNDKKTTR